jgi:hypothetical protein
LNSNPSQIVLYLFTKEKGNSIPRKFQGNGHLKA